MSPGNLVEYISIGKIVATHGVRGGMVVLPLTDFPERFRKTRRVFLKRGGTVVGEGNVARASVLPRKVLLWLESVDRVEKAASLVGCEIAVQRSEAVQIPAGSYFIFEIVGLKVRTTDGRIVGEVKEVLRLPANDVYVVQTAEGGEVLIPAIRQVVTKIDLEQGEMLIEPMPGLLGDD